MESIIEVKNLTKSFSGRTVVDSISFSVEKGSLFAFLGQNGAGKTTTINIIIGLLSRDKGEVLYQGSSDFLTFKNKVGVVFQNNILDDLLTVEENFHTYSALYHRDKNKAKAHCDRVVKLLSLEDVYKQQFKTLSGGQKRRAEIGRALLTSPEILFLDEPTTGLDPKTRADVWQIITELKDKEGMTIFLTTHYMEEAGWADKVAIINRGKIEVTGSPFELKATYSSDRLIVTPLDSETLEKQLGSRGLPFNQIGLNYEVEFSDPQISITYVSTRLKKVRWTTCSSMWWAKNSL